VNSDTSDFVFLSVKLTLISQGCQNFRNKPILANITTKEAGATKPANVPSHCCDGMSSQYKQRCDKDGRTMPALQVK
jgi:hypothetical protein